MEPIVLLGLALGLSMDALAVAAAEGAFLKKIHFRKVFRLAFTFGAFQGFMPVLGWAAGTTFRKYIMDFDHWIAFIILFYIGGKMVYEETMNDKKGDKKQQGCDRMGMLLLMALATSIDALAVGLTFAFLEIDILLPVLAIGGLTFLVSGLGVYFGSWIGRKYEKIIGLIGGSVLMIIGLKILLDHLVSGR